MNAITKIEIEQLPIGIHFGVPDETYFAQNALGSTDKKELAIDPVEWNFKRLHGDDKSSPAKVWGSGLHARTLEGIEAFERRFQAEPIKPEDALETKADLTDWLDKHRVPYKAAAAKPELIRLAKSIDPDVIVWDEVIAAFKADVPEDRRVSADTVREINLAAEWMQADPMLSPFMKDGTFQFGAPELTVIYEVRGVRCRARFDYLFPGDERPKIIDLKRYSPWRNGNPVKGITQAIGNFRYDLQAADYLLAYEEAIRLCAAERVFGDEPYDGFLDRTFRTGELPDWIWVFIKGEGAPQPRVVRFPQELTVFKVAKTQIEVAIERYRQNVAAYGLEQDWPPIPGAVHLDDTDFPSWFGNN